MSRRKKKRGGRRKTPCSACGEPVTLLIPRGPWRVCRDCVRLSALKLEAAVGERLRIEAAA